MTPSRKGFNPIKLPFAIKSSDRTFASWANEVVTALQQLRDRIPQANISRTGTASVSRPPLWTTLSQVPESDPAEYQVSVTLGYLTYQNAGASEADQGVTGYIVPKIDGVDLDSEQVKPLKLPAVVSYVYLRVKTTADGVPKFSVENPPVTIEAFDEPQKSVHHVRPSPSGGEEEGDYFFLICETEEIPDSDPAAPRIKRRLTGNRELPNQLVEIENIGGHRELYKGYEVGPDDKHQLRTLEQTEDRGEAILVDEPQGGEGDTIKFKSIAERATQPQVRVTTQGQNIVQIEGNGKDLNYTDPFQGQINFIDGLVSDIQGGAFTGWWGTIEWVFEAANGNEETYLHLRQTFTNGILTNVEYWSGLAPVAAPGTENAPGGIVFNITES